MDPYEWDEAKNAANRLKHGVTFEVIAGLDWSAATIVPDDRFDYGEARMMAYGWIDGRAHAVAFVVRGDRVRIFSMRYMHDKEIRRYVI